MATSDDAREDPAVADQAAPTAAPAVPSAPAAPVEVDLSGLPAGFVWGAATAAFQIEGDAENRGDSIWDAFCREPGRVRDGSDGTVACDHVHRYPEDVALLRDLGVDAYRFSISWPRVQPGGTGSLNPTGLGFYDRLLDELLGAGIDPWVTLYHWDLPTELQQAGGWPERDIVERYVDYAVAVHAALGDRVRHWTTFNEPWCAAWLGYGAGVHAPGIADYGQAARATHHLLLAHGQAVAAMREQAPADHEIGIVLNPGQFRPAADVPAEEAGPVIAAGEVLDGIQTRWWLDALMFGAYPQDTFALLEPYLDGAVLDGDLELIAQPIDFLGVNYYSDQVLVPASSADRPLFPSLPGTEGAQGADPGPDATTMGWPVTPDGLRTLLVRLATDYPGLPLVVTENGAAYHDDRAELVPRAETDQRPIADPQRVDYLRKHLGAIAAASREGVDLRGYFVWSLLDNFEWAEGYTQRFGIVRVDFETGERRIRDSFTTYRGLIAAQRALSPVVGAPTTPSA